MTLTIPANDHGQLRIFSLDMDAPQALQDKSPEGIVGAFGVLLNKDYVDVVDTNALGDMTLGDYIVQGYDMKPDAADLAALGQINGWVVLVMSRASDGAETVLDLTPGLHHVTTIGEKAVLTPHPPLESDSAKGVLTPPTKSPKSDARIGGMVATLALLTLFILVALMIWIAG